MSGSLTSGMTISRIGASLTECLQTAMVAVGV
jgi:hypothetical protein